jgi:hypothetical protein
MVNFLDIAPKVASETFAVESQDGPIEVELTGVPFLMLADIAKRYPMFARILDGAAGSMLEASEAMPALIAAGLGHPGSTEYETKIRSFPAADIMGMAMVVIRLTFPRVTAGPLPEAPPATDGADGGARIVTSL